MTIDDKIWHKKLQYDINRKDAKISALLSGKINKYEFVTGEEILPSGPNQIIQKAKFTNSPLGKTFEIKTEQVDALKSLNYPNKINELKKIESIFPKKNDLIIDKLKEIVQ